MQKANWNRSRLYFDIGVQSTRRTRRTIDPRVFTAICSMATGRSRDPLVWIDCEVWGMQVHGQAFRVD